MVEFEAGESVVIKARAVDPITKHIITDADGSAHAWCTQEHDHDGVHSVRTPMAFDSISRNYLATLDTTRFCKGVWLVQTHIEGGLFGYRSQGHTKVTVK